MTNLHTCLAAAALLTSLPAQSLAEGYRGHVTGLPSAAGQVLQVGDGVVYFTGTELVLRAGATTRTLLKLPASVFGSFTIRTGDETLLFGESSNGGLWTVPLGAGTPKQLATVKFNFSATRLDADRAIVSAKTGGFSSKDNDLVAVDLRTGAVDTIAIVPGASGPVCTDGHGNLYYVTASNAFPAPPGQADVVRFSAAQVQGALGPGHLGIGDAAVLHRGLDAAGSIALDGDQDLFVVDWMNAQVVELSDVWSPHPVVSVLATYKAAPVSPSAVQFVPGRHFGLGIQQLEPFQPEGGGALIVHETKFGTTSQLRAVTAARPTLESTAAPVPPATPFSLVVRGGRDRGTAWVALGLGRHHHEVAFRLPHSEAPVFWSRLLLQPLLLAPVSFDSSRTARLPLFNPGFPSGLAITAQGYFDAPGSAGSTAPVVVELR